MRERKIVYGGVPAPTNEMMFMNSSAHQSSMKNYHPMLGATETQQTLVSQDAMLPGFDQWIGAKSQANLFDDDDDNW